MATSIEVITADEGKPFLFLYGETHPLFFPFIKKHNENLKFMILTEGVANSFDSINNNIYLIKTSQIDLFLAIKETISYAVFFLQNEKDINYFSSIVKKLEKDKTRIALVVPIRNISIFYNILLEFKAKKNITILFIGDLYGQTIPNDASLVSSLIHSALSKKSIQLSGNDLYGIFPISDSDAINGITHAIFGSKRKDNYYYLFYIHPQTFVSAVHLLRRVEPDLEIQFESEKDHPTSATHQDIEKQIKDHLYIKPDYIFIKEEAFEESIKQLYIQDNQLITIKRVHSRLKNISSHVKNSIGKSLFAGFIISIFIFITFNAIIVLALVLSINKTINSFKKKDIGSIISSTATAKILIPIIKPTAYAIKNIPIIDKIILDDYHLLEQIENFADLTNYYKESIVRDKNISNSDLEIIIADSHYVFFELLKISFEQSSKYSFIKAVDIDPYTPLISLTQILPDVLGFKKEVNYLLLFQNNAELRPTGGFIGSIGELRLKSKEVEDFKIRDVYELDGQLTAHVEPHYIIRRYLQPHLYLRDSNFSIDYEQAASISSLLYRLESGKTADGVIAIDFDVIKQILKTIGPIKLTNYNKTLDDKNSQEFLQDTIESNFFPGSTQKKDLLTELYRKISEKLKDPNNLTKIALSIPQLIQDKHILFFIDDPYLQNLFTVNNYSNSYKDFRERKENNINDFLALNEANIGVNKVNSKIFREVKYESEFIDQEILSKVNLTLSNTSKKDDYKAYIRVVTPLNSALRSIFINGEEEKLTNAVSDFSIYESKTFKPPDGLEVDKTIESQKQVFGFIATVPKNSKQKIEVAYVNGLGIPNSNLINYNLFFLKQPGTAPYQLNTSLKAKEYKLKSGKSESSNMISKDFRHEAKLKKQDSLSK